MQKTKIQLIASLTTVFVAMLNVSTALIAFELLIPEEPTRTSLVSNDTTKPVVVLPTPEQQAPTNVTPTSAVPANTPVEFRAQSDKLVAGATPQPTAIATNPDGKKVYKWCSGVNPDLPDEVCQAIISIAASPVTSNPHLGPKAVESLSLLPANSSMVMDERSWSSSGANSGTMFVMTSTPEYGDVRIKIFLEKQNGIWVLVDGQLA